MNNERVSAHCMECFCFGVADEQGKKHRDDKSKQCSASPYENNNFLFINLSRALFLISSDNDRSGVAI